MFDGIFANMENIEVNNITITHGCMCFKSEFMDWTKEI